MSKKTLFYTVNGQLRCLRCEQTARKRKKLCPRNRRQSVNLRENSLQVGLTHERQSVGMLSTALRFISSATFA